MRATDDEDTADSDRNHDGLVGALDESIGLLRRLGVTLWVEWLDGDRSRIVQGDGYAYQPIATAHTGQTSAIKHSTKRCNDHLKPQSAQRCAHARSPYRSAELATLRRQLRDPT